MVGAKIFADEFQDMCPEGCTKQHLNSKEEAMALYVVEVVAESHLSNQQLISYMVPTWQVQWQWKHIRFNLNYPTCTLLEFSKNGQRLVVVSCKGASEIVEQETMCPSPIRDKAQN